MFGLINENLYDRNKTKIYIKIHKFMLFKQARYELPIETFLPYSAV